LYDGACRQEVSPGWVQVILGERPPYVPVKGHKNGNANEPVAIKCSMPYTADFGFGQMMKYISTNKHCDCGTITLVISVNRPTFVSPVTTTICDVP
jgi:hypothetical protein